MRIELSSAPLNDAVAKLERIAALYEKIGAAQGGVTAGTATAGGGFRAAGVTGGRVVSGRASVGGRGSVIEGIMRGQPGIPREAAAAMAANLPADLGEAAGAGGIDRGSRLEERSAFEEERIANRGRRLLATNQANAYRQGVSEFRRAQARQEAMKKASMREADRLVNDEYRAIVKERREEFGGGAGGGRGGAGGAGAGGRGLNFRDRLRTGLPGMSVGFGGPWLLAGLAVTGFTAAIRSSIQAINELHRAALVTGGSMQEVGRLQTLGVQATEANALRDRLRSDPFAIMTMGYQPDPRLGGSQDNAALQQRAIDILRRLRGNPEQQLMTARRLGVGADELRAANLGDDVYQQTQEYGRRFTPTGGQASRLADTEQRFSNFWQRLRFGVSALFDPALYQKGLLPGRFGNRGESYLEMINRERGQEQKGPGSMQDSASVMARAAMELASTMKQFSREFYGRGVQNRGALPDALWGADLFRGIRSGAIRFGSFH